MSLGSDVGPTRKLALASTLPKINISKDKFLINISPTVTTYQDVMVWQLVKLYKIKELCLCRFIHRYIS